MLLGTHPSPESISDEASVNSRYLHMNFKYCSRAGFFRPAASPLVLHSPSFLNFFKDTMNSMLGYVCVFSY